MEDKIPFELWLEILSYLPRSYRRKMIGVSRSLFEYAMDEVFRELTLASDDERALFMITRLQDENIAKRVTRLTIRISTSLCTSTGPSQVENDAIASDRSQKTGKNRFFRFLKSNEPKGSLERIHRFSQQWNLNDMFWSFAERNIMLCTNAQELDIVLDAKGSTISPSFESFLHSIWLPSSILPGIRKLNIQATSHNLAKFILPMHHFANSWRKLEHIEIKIDPSHSFVITDLLIHPFLDPLKDKLVSFTLSGHLIPNIANILRFSPTFSKLRRFELHTSFNLRDTMQQVEYLNTFLTSHSKTLEHITMSPQDQVSSSTFTTFWSYRFILWLGPSYNASLIQGHQTLSQLSLPHLRTLELSYDYQSIDGPLYPRSVFPSLSTLAPNLTTLTIAQAELSLRRVSELLELLPRGRDGVCALERLDLSIEILTPELVHLLSRDLESLRWLTLRLARYVVSSDLEQYIFYQIIRTHRYPSWKLEHLRIVASSACGTPHPNTLAMQAVAETLRDPPILDTSYDCQCHLLCFGSKPEMV